MSKFRNICHVISVAFFTLCVVFSSNSAWAAWTDTGYRIYWDDGSLVYIGQSGSIKAPFLDSAFTKRMTSTSNPKPFSYAGCSQGTVATLSDGYGSYVFADGYITTAGLNAVSNATSTLYWMTYGCVSECPSGRYFDAASNTCVTCPTSGYKCPGVTIDSSKPNTNQGLAAISGAITLDSARWTTNSPGNNPPSNNPTTSVAPSTVYTAYGVGVYYDSVASAPITTLQTKPAITGYNFAGFYTTPATGGTQVIDADGKFTAEASKQISSSGITAKWYAHWSKTCSAGYYLKGSNSSCTACPENYYCLGGSWTYSSSDQGKTPCDNGYTTSSTGSTSSSSCKKTVTLDKVGGSGSLTAISGAGSISQTSATSDAILTCTQGSNCYLPNANTLTPPKGWEYTGGWETTGGVPPCFATFTANTTPTSTSYYACTKTKVYNLPLITILGATGDPLDKGGTGVLCYKNYATVGSTTASKGVYWHSASEPNPACSSVSISADNKVVANQTIELPTRHGYTFMGYYTKNGWSDDDWGIQAITSLGVINSSWLDNFDTYMIGPESTQQYLFARWSIIEKQCAAGTFLFGTSLSCEPCPAGYYCEGGTYSSEGENVGITGVCNTNTYSTGGASAATCTPCTSGYVTSGTAATNHDQKSDCFKQITLDKNEGSGTISTTKTCYEGNTCDFPDASGLTKDGYMFTGGWGTSQSCTNLSGTSVTTPTSGTYYACKVALNKNDGSGTLSFTSSTKCSSSGCTFPDASGLTQDGYAFKGGWGTSANCTATTTTFSSITSSTYYACKTANSITITWTGANGGTGNTKITTTDVLYDGDISTPMAAIVSNAGQTFLGWKFEK